MDRLSRLVVLISACLCVALQTVLGARAWQPLSEIVPVVVILAALLGRFVPSIGWWAVLLPAYGYPVLVAIFSVRFDAAYVAIWAGALVGFIAGHAGISGWALPVRWRLPLALWALTIAFVWPVVAWRELDYAPELFHQYHLAVSNRGIPPPVQLVWIAHVAGLHLIGLLWIDSLFREFGGDAPRFMRRVAWPLATSALLTTGLALYQMFGDIRFLNQGLFINLGRVSGATLDANTYGMLAALWVPGLVVLARQTTRPVVAALSVAGAAALAVGVWGSGSRTALLALIVGLAGLAIAGLRSYQFSRRALTIAGLVAVVALAIAVVIARSPSAAIGPLARMGEFANRPLGSVIAELWNRNDYGKTSSQMFAAFPLVGVGVGTFNGLVADYSIIFNQTILDPDNAQNWFRHQLAEFGLMGSIGWIAWVVMFVGVIVKPVPANRHEMSARAIKAALAGLALASLLGMPTQSPPLLLTFWTFVFWCITLTGADQPARSSANSGRLIWAGIWILAVAFAASTAYVGVKTLRVPYRALQADWGYVYGLYDLERSATPDAFWWTRQRSVSVVPAEGRYLKLTFWVHNPDLATTPVRVKIWRTSQLIVDQSVSTATPVVRYVRLADGSPRAMIETWVSRTWTPADRGGSDWRVLGLALGKWTFVDAPPEGAVVIN